MEETAEARAYLSQAVGARKKNIWEVAEEVSPEGNPSISTGNWFDYIAAKSVAPNLAVSFPAYTMAKRTTQDNPNFFGDVSIWNTSGALPLQECVVNDQLPKASNHEYAPPQSHHTMHCLPAVYCTRRISDDYLPSVSSLLGVRSVDRLPHVAAKHARGLPAKVRRPQTGECEQTISNYLLPHSLCRCSICRLGLTAWYLDDSSIHRHNMSMYVLGMIRISDISGGYADRHEICDRCDGLDALGTASCPFLTL